jgi:hypothetical protein
LFEGKRCSEVRKYVGQVSDELGFIDLHAVEHIYMRCDDQRKKV